MIVRGPLVDVSMKWCPKTKVYLTSLKRLMMRICSSQQDIYAVMPTHNIIDLMNGTFDEVEQKFLKYLFLQLGKKLHKKVISEGEGTRLLS